MKKLNHVIMWLAITAIWLLAVLSVLGAFLGADSAGRFFNSTPLALFWSFLAALLTAGFVEFPRLIRRPGLFMIHAGGLLVLAGAMWGSQAGHRLQKRLLGIDKIPSGYMVIYEGDLENHVIAADFSHRLGELPFSIKLKDFRLAYYPADNNSARLYITTPDGRHLQLAARSGEEVSLGKGKGKLKVVRTFKNFKIHLENGKKTATDEQTGEKNPAVEDEIELPDGSSYTRYAFERFAGFTHAQDGLQLSYVSQGPRMIRDYFSDVAVIENGKEVVKKTIEVNRPLHYRGYHFYQYSYDPQAGSYTVLSVTSDSGLYTVYGGYWLLGLGVLWRFWLRHIIGQVKNRKK